MNNAMKALLMAALLPLSAMAQDSTQFIKGSWAEITAKARKEHKPIFIDTYFEGCHACKDMEMKVFPRPEVKKYMQDNFVCTGFDVFKEEFGMELCKKYFMRGFPTYLIISGEGQLVNRFSGFQEADKFMQYLRRDADLYKAGKYLSGFNSNITPGDPSFYRAMWDKNYQGGNKEEILAFMNGQQDLLSEKAFKVMLMMRELTPACRDFYLKNRTAYTARFGEELSNTVLDKVLSQDIAKLPAAYDKAAFEAFLQQQQQTFNAADWTYAQMFYAENYLFKKCKDARAFLEFAAAHPDTNDNRVRYMNFYMGQELSKDPSLKVLYIKWAAPVLTQESNLEALRTLAYMCKDVDKVQSRKYFTWALAKAERLGEEAAYLKKGLQELDN